VFDPKQPLTIGRYWATVFHAGGEANGLEQAPVDLARRSVAKHLQENSQLPENVPACYVGNVSLPPDWGECGWQWKIYARVLPPVNLKRGEP
jgi:hypothetical protein